MAAVFYPALFFGSSLLFFLSGKARGSLSFILAALGILAPCVIAGARDVWVGTDVAIYAVWMHDSALKMGFVPFVTQWLGEAGLAFNVFTWITSRLCGSLAGYLFCIQLAIILPIYLVLRKRAPEFAWVGMLIYLLMLYPCSLNAMKQMMAVSITLCAFPSVVDQRPVRFAGLVFLAILFHQTAIVTLFVYPLGRFVLAASSAKAFFGKAQMAVICLVVIVVFVISLLFGERFVLALSVLKDSYAYQVRGLGGGSFYFATLAPIAGCITAFALAHNAFSSNDLKDEQRLLCLLALIGCFAYSLDVVATGLFRFSYYGWIYMPLLAANMGRERHSLLTLGVVVLVACAAAYFVYDTMYRGGSSVYPYTSTILGLS